MLQQILLLSMLSFNIISFNVINTDDGIRIFWTSNYYDNTEKYIINVSTDGIEYNILDVVYHDTDVSMYEYMDGNTYSGNVYYMIEQVDFDGYINRSDIKNVSIESGLAIRYSSGSLTVRSDISELIFVYNYSGELYAKWNILDPNGFEATVNTSNWGAGVYLVIDNNGNCIKYMNN